MNKKYGILKLIGIRAAKNINDLKSYLAYLRKNQYLWSDDTDQELINKSITSQIDGIEYILGNQPTNNNSLKEKINEKFGEEINILLLKKYNEYQDLKKNPPIYPKHSLYNLAKIDYSSVNDQEFIDYSLDNDIKEYGNPLEDRSVFFANNNIFNEDNEEA